MAYYYYCVSGPSAKVPKVGLTLFKIENSRVETGVSVDDIEPVSDHYLPSDRGKYGTRGLPFHESQSEDQKTSRSVGVTFLDSP